MNCYCRVRCLENDRFQVPSVVRAVYKTQLREGVDEIRHANGVGTTPILGNVGNHKNSKAGLSGAYEVQRVRRQVPRIGAQAKTAAQRHAEQVSSRGRIDRSVGMDRIRSWTFFFLFSSCAQRDLPGHLGKTLRRISAGNKPGIPAGEPGTAPRTGTGGHTEHGGHHAAKERPRLPGSHSVYGKKTERDQAASDGTRMDAAPEVRDTEARSGQGASHVQRPAAAETVQPAEGTWIAPGRLRINVDLSVLVSRRETLYPRNEPIFR